MIYANSMATQQGSASFLVKMREATDRSVVSPITLQWTLTDEAGTVINSRSAVSVSLTAGQAETPIFLSGDDLQILAGESSRRYARRRLVVEATYRKAESASNPATEIVYFFVENLGL